MIPLTSLANSLRPLQARFRRDENKLRLLVVVSPT